MPISFPSSPTTNQTYTVGSKTWIWNGYAWDLQIANTQSVTAFAQAAFNTANNALANTGALVTSNPLTQYIIGNTTTSTSNTTGALVVNGGVGITGNLNISNTFSVLTIPSSVNYLQVAGNTSGNSVFVSAQSPDANASILIKSKGSGSIDLATGLGLQVRVLDIGTDSSKPLQLYGASSAQGLVAPTGASLQFSTNQQPIDFFTFGRGSSRQFRVSGPTSTVNYLQVAGSTTGNSISISGQGSDANVSIDITPKGNASVRIIANTYVANLIIANTNGGITFIDGTFQSTAGSSVANTLYLQSVNDYQNTTISSADTLARNAYGVANNALANTGALVTSNPLTRYTFSNTTTSTSITTGALTVGGGLGVSGRINAIEVKANLFSFANGTNITNDSVGKFYISSIPNDVTNISNALYYNTVTGELTYNAVIDSSARANTVYTQGVDATQNTNIASADALARAAFNKANTGGGGGSSTGYLANSVIFADSTGTLSNTANLQFVSTTNTVKANASLVLANTSTTNSATILYNAVVNSIDFYFY